MTGFEEIEKEFVHALLSVDKKKAEKILSDLSGSYGMTDITDSLLAPAFETIGAGWEDGSVTLSQICVCVSLCEQLMDKVLKADVHESKRYPKMAMAVIEDYHSLGKKMLLYVLRFAGYEVLDYGHGLSTTEVVERALEEDIDILLVSAHMLHSALLIRNMIKILKLRDAGIKVVVGGAPFDIDKDLWKKVGADAMGSNAADAIGLVKRMTGEGA